MYHQPVLTIFNSGIYLYGICMAVGIICCFVFLLFCMERIHCNDESINKMLLFGIVATGFGVFMAAVFQGIYNYIDNPEAGFSLNGLTFYGGLIGGVCGFLILYNLYIYVVAPHCKGKIMSNHMNVAVCDGLTFIPIGIGIAHAFGRLGCTFAGCCHGSATTAWYGVFMYARSLGTYATVVPTQLFECIFIIALTVVMAILYFKFKFEYNMGIYCIGYGVFRFCIEFIRGDDRGSFVAGLTPSQFWAIIMVVLGIAYFFVHKYFFKRFMKHPELQPYTPKEEKEAKLLCGYSINSIIVEAFIAVALILGAVGLCVNFTGGTTPLKLGSAMSGYSNYKGLLTMSYLTFALIVWLLIGYFVYFVLKQKTGKEYKALKFSVLGVSIAIFVFSLATLMLSNTLHIGTSVLSSGAGAWLLVIGGIVCAISGAAGALKKR